MFSFDLNERTRLRASWGRFHQADSVDELHVEDGEVGFARPQSSDHTIIDLEHVDGHGIAWRTELYQKKQTMPRPRYENQLNPLSLLPEIEPDRVRIDPNGAHLRGVEVSAGYTSKLWNWHLSYAWSYASDEIDRVDTLRAGTRRTALMVRSTGGAIAGRWDRPLERAHRLADHAARVRRRREPRARTA